MPVPAPEEVAGFVVDLTQAGGADPGMLLQHLYRTQHRYSHVPAFAIDLLSRALSVPKSQIRGVIEFYAFLHLEPRGDFDILISDSITDHMLGSRELLERLCERLGVRPGVPRPDGRVTVATTSCTGMCDQGPAGLVNGMAVTRLDEKRVDRIAELVEAGTALEDWPAEFFEVRDNIRRKGILLGAEHGDGSALEVLRKQGPDRMLAEIEHSGLRGRGGAGFNVGMKWRMCRETADEERVVVCNADEGEPGTFKDRVLLHSYADAVFEGMTLCAGVIGARHGYIYLRAEYHYLREHLAEVLDRRREQGLLGTGILGQPGFDFDIEIHMGAGAYICGEESALLESLEGRRGVSRKRPPFPAISGYRSQPTVVNNVETFLAATRIAVNGGAWFRNFGTEQSPGTRLLSISGDCANPGIYEYPFGVTIEEVLRDCAPVDAQAVQIAGAAGLTLPSGEFGRRIAFEDVPTGGSFIVFDQRRDLLDMVKNFTDFFVHESCGFCTPCRVGGALLKNLVDKAYAGHASDYDLQEMRNIGAVMKATSHCGLGKTAPNPVLETLGKFPEIYRRRIRHASYEPAFDLDGALEEARQITGRDDAGAHLKEDA